MKFGRQKLIKIAQIGHTDCNSSKALPFVVVVDDD